MIINANNNNNNNNDNDNNDLGGGNDNDSNEDRRHSNDPNADLLEYSEIRLMLMMTMR